MANYNKVILVGTVVKDIEIRKAGEVIVGTSTIVCNKKYKDKETAMFLDFVAFGKLAENLNKFATKGAQLLLDGELVQNTWEKDGKKQSKHQLNVITFQLLGSKQAKGNASAFSDMDDDDEVLF